MTAGVSPNACRGHVGTIGVQTICGTSNLMVVVGGLGHINVGTGPGRGGSGTGWGQEGEDHCSGDAPTLCPQCRAQS